MAFRTALIHFLLRRLGHTPAEQPAHSPPPEAPVSSAEQEQIVRVALIPDPSRAIDATLGHLHPLEEIGGFTCVVHLDDIDEPLNAIVRKVLSAGSAIKMVRPDDVDPRCYQVHGQFYKLLARLRLDGTLHPVTSPAELTNGLKANGGPTKILAPTESDINSALSDVANELSDFVILARNAHGYADFIQMGAGSAPFRVESRIWLNNTFAEHFHITDPQCPDGFAHIDDVAKVMLHWLATGRLPQYVKIRNITEELRPLERVPIVQPLKTV